MPDDQRHDSAYHMDIEEGWGDEPQPAEPTVEWLHMRAGDTKEVVILSTEPIRYKGHWDNQIKLMRRCERPQTCPSWQPGTPCRWEKLGRPRPRFILVALWQGSQWLWEFGEMQRDQVLPLRDAHGGLEGLPLVLMKPRGNNNPPLIVRAGEVRQAGEATAGPLPPCVDAKAVVFGTWVRQGLKAGKGAPSLPPSSAASASSTPNRLPRSGLSSPGAPNGEIAEQWQRQDEAEVLRARSLFPPSGEGGEPKQEPESETEGE